MLKIAWHSCYAHPLPNHHRFPMEKYDLLPQQLLHEGTINKNNIFEPNPASEEQILAIHDKEYWEKLTNLSLSRQEERKTGFPLSKELITREVLIMGGSIEACDFALENGIAMNIAGGTHHAYSNSGEGFCLLNDLAISAKHLQNHHGLEKILVIDLDVHQGNGTAAIFEGDDSVFTFSMHGAKNYPMHKEKSDWDIPLEDGISDEEYLSLLEKALPQLLQKVKPDFILYQCGVDVLSTDKLGRMNMTLKGCKKRDELVLQMAFENKIPLMASMGGGYSPEIKVIVEAHANTYRLAQEIYF